MSVRDALLGDAAAMSAVQARSWRIAYRGIVPDDFLDGLTDGAWAERWSRTLAMSSRTGTHDLVATDPTGTVVAVAGCGPSRDEDPGPTGELYLIYTDPDHWGQGHGSELLTTVHDRLLRDGHPQALLWVAAENERSIAFYERHGWATDGVVRQDVVNGVAINEARMVRELN